MYPSREEFTELIYYISELKHQYSSKIDEQTIKLNDQSGVIEELLWQIRELSDKMRQMSQKVVDIEKQLADNNDKCVCRYENHIPRNRSIFSRQTSMLSNRNTARIAKDKTIDDDDNDVYETIEFSDSSSHVYTEPVRDYGVLRKVNIKTSLRQRASRKPPSGLKKSAGSRNLQKFSAMQNLQVVENEENEPKVELRTKPDAVNDPENSLISGVAAEFTHTESLDSSIRPRDASGILINFECLNSRLRSDFQDRVSF